ESECSKDPHSPLSQTVFGNCAPRDSPNGLRSCGSRRGNPCALRGINRLWRTGCDMKTGFGDSADKVDAGATSAKAEQTRICAVCRSKFMFSSFTEFCPVCVLRGALRPALGSSHGSLRKAPGSSTLTRLPLRFEHYELAKGEDGKPL